MERYNIVKSSYTASCGCVMPNFAVMFHISINQTNFFRLCLQMSFLQKLGLFLKYNKIKICDLSNVNYVNYLTKKGFSVTNLTEFCKYSITQYNSKKLGQLESWTNKFIKCWSRLIGNRWGYYGWLYKEQPPNSSVLGCGSSFCAQLCISPFKNLLNTTLWRL